MAARRGGDAARSMRVLAAPRGPALIELSAGAAQAGGGAAGDRRRPLPCRARCGGRRGGAAPAGGGAAPGGGGRAGGRAMPRRELRALVAALGCPALVTYKAKGVIADADPHFAGIFTCGAAEGPVLRQRRPGHHGRRRSGGVHPQALALAGAGDRARRPRRGRCPMRRRRPRCRARSAPALAAHHRGRGALRLGRAGDRRAARGLAADAGERPAARRRDRAAAPGGDHAGGLPQGRGSTRAWRSMPGRTCSPPRPSGSASGPATC